MTKFIIPIALLILFGIALKLIELFGQRKPIYEYGRKDFLMTRAERECYDALVAEMGAVYSFFPQIHLDALVVPKSAPKSRLYAFRHINQKSVDFVACDKKEFRPVFAIELDDKTHSQSERITRDKEVERILHGARIPLIRIKNRGRFIPKELAQEVQRGIDDYMARLNRDSF